MKNSQELFKTNNNLILFDNIDSFPDFYVNYIKGIDYKNIELSQFKVDNDIIEKLKKYQTYAYHCTRLVDVNSVLNYGLVIPSQSSELINDFKNNIIKSNILDNNEIENLFKNYEFSPGRGETIHYAGTRMAIMEDSGCIPLWKYYGGELLLDILSKTKDRKKYECCVKKILEIGKPYLITLIIDVEEIKFYLEDIVKNDIRLYNNDINNEILNIPQFEKFTDNPIKRDRIIKIEEVQDKIILNKIKNYTNI